MRKNGIQNQVIFVNDDPFEKARIIEKQMPISDRVFFIDFGIQVDEDSMENIFNDNVGHNIIVFPSVKEGINWDMFKEKVLSKSNEPIHQMGLEFDTTLGKRLVGDIYQVDKSDAKSWVIMCKPTLKKIRNNRYGSSKVPPKFGAMFSKFQEYGVNIVAFTAARLVNVYPHECIGNIVNSAGVKTTLRFKLKHTI